MDECNRMRKWLENMHNNLSVRTASHAPPSVGWPLRPFVSQPRQATVTD
jgi:hypothetical protein